MRKVLLGLTLLVISAQAGLPEKVAASYAAKYEVCALKLKDTPTYGFKALGLKIKADQIHKDMLLNKGYLKAFSNEKKRAWLISLSKCKNIANKLK